MKFSGIDGLSGFREDNRLEAKRAAGGLPKSIWVTYSAFANTAGGLILLGVDELPDKSLKVVGIDNPEKLVSDFWNTVNNTGKVNVNILQEKNVRIIEIEKKQVVTIEIPRAERADKPVFINNDLFACTYRRNGDGDYRCSKTAVQAMVRDAGNDTLDTKVLSGKPFAVFNYNSVKSYRQRMRLVRPGHVWEELSDDEFLFRLGAAGRGEDEKLYPTAAGLLMFGNEYEIIREFPYFFLDYQEHFDMDTRYSDRIISSSGDWSGNLYDFFYKVYNRLSQAVKVPFIIENGRDRVEDTPVHKALREALANCLINTDFYGEAGVVVRNYPDRLVFENPGVLRIRLEEAISGGLSSPRNVYLMKMFNLLNIGERAGSGIPSIYHVWANQDFGKPVFEERFVPERTVLLLPVKKVPTMRADKKVPTMSADKKVPTMSADKKASAKTLRQKETVMRLLKETGEVRSTDVAGVLAVNERRARVLLQQLTQEGLIVPHGGNRNRTYKL